MLSPLLDDQIARNRRRATTMVAGLVLVVVLVVSVPGALLGAGLLGPAVGVLVATAVALGAHHRSTAVILRSSRARPADPVEYARVHNLVEGLCAGAGLPKPEVYVVDDDGLNAFVGGRTPRDAVIAVTTGLARALSRIELEGVLAHLLSRVKNHDILDSSLAVTVLGPLVRVLPARQAARLLEVALGDRREAVADLTAVSLTRYPPGLISALEKLRGGRAAVRYASPATAHLWLVPPLTGQNGGGFVAQAALEERIDALREL